MGDEKSLFAGLDLCRTEAQLTWFDERKMEPESLRVSGEAAAAAGEYLIPMVLAVKPGNKEWLFGQEAYLGLRLKRLFEYVRTVYLRRSAGGGQVAGEDVERRRLACAVRAEKAHYLALGDIECDVLEHVLCAEIFVYTVDLDHVRTLPPF